MTEDDKDKKEKTPQQEGGIEYRATIRFPRKDYEFMQKLIEEGEYTNITEIVRDAVKRFRLEWRDMEAVRDFMPMRRMMGMSMMPMMKRMMMQMPEGERQKKKKR
ncbi:MAG: ribbon-helix-helix domain-containing protein [Thermoplasmata archaeon]